MDKLTVQRFWNTPGFQAEIEAFARRERARAFKSLLKQVWQALRA